MSARVTSTTADDARYLDQQLYGIPRRSASMWALRKFAGLRAGAGLRHVGKKVAACLERGDRWFGGRRKAIASVAYRF